MIEHLNHKRAVVDGPCAAQPPATVLTSIEGLEPPIIDPFKRGWQLLKEDSTLETKGIVAVAHYELIVQPHQAACESGSLPTMQSDGAE